MVHVSQVAYATGGAFLNLGYFDLPYYVLVIMVLTRALVEKEVISSPELTLREAKYMSPKFSRGAVQRISEQLKLRSPR